MNVVALSHQRGEMKPLVLLRELFKAVLQIFSHFGGGVVGLFVERENNAVVFSHFGIGFGRVIRNEDVGHIPQINGIHSFYDGVKQHQILQLFQIRDFIAYPNQIINTAFSYVSSRHGKVLRCQDFGNHIHCQRIAHIGFFRF